MKRLLLLFVGAAIDTRIDDGRCRSSTAFCTALIALPKSRPFQSRRNGDVALQVFAANFVLARQLLYVASELRVAVCPVELLSSVLLIACRELRLASGIAHANGVGDVVGVTGVAAGSPSRMARGIESQLLRG